MDFLLQRRYGKQETRGVLSLDGKPWSLTLERPCLKRDPQGCCIPEGKYELTLAYTERSGWYLEVKNESGITAAFRPLKKGAVPPPNAICPVSRFVGDCRFSELATMKLLERMERMQLLDEPMTIRVTSFRRT